MLKKLVGFQTKFVYWHLFNDFTKMIFGQKYILEELLSQMQLKSKFHFEYHVISQGYLIKIVWKLAQHFFRSSFLVKVEIISKIVKQISQLCMIEISIFSKLIKGPRYSFTLHLQYFVCPPFTFNSSD